MTAPAIAQTDSVLLPYQQRWIADTSDVKVAEKSRRVGLTWAEAADDALYAASDAGDDVYYIGYDQDLALEFIETVGMWAEHFQLAAHAIEDGGEVLDEEDKAKGILAFKIRFASGHKVVALSSNPRKLRGKQGRVVVDEAAFHDNLAELLKAVMALTIWGGKIRIISTHNGDENAFAELVNDIRAGKAPFSLHRITFDEAVADGLIRRTLAKRGVPWSPEAEAAEVARIYGLYRNNADEELRVIPKPGGGAYLPGALVQKRMLADTPVLRWGQPASFSEEPSFVREIECQAWLDAVVSPVLDTLDDQLESVFGEDFGRSGDLTVIWPAQIRRDLVRHTPFIVELRNIPFEQQRQILFFIVDGLPRFRAGKLDSRGNGQYLAEVTMQRYGSTRIEMVMLSAEWYRANMPPYKAAYEDATIDLPRDAEILNDHRALRVVNGVGRVPETSTSAPGESQRHGDSAIAGCMMFAASNAEPAEYGYQPAPRAKGRADDGASADDDGYVFGGGTATAVSHGGFGRGAF